jgi:hypothetical protein
MQVHGGTVASWAATSLRLNDAKQTLLPVPLIKALSELLTLAHCEKRYGVHQTPESFGVHGNSPKHDIFLI